MFTLAEITALEASGGMQFMFCGTCKLSTCARSCPARIMFQARVEAFLAGIQSTKEEAGL